MVTGGHKMLFNSAEKQLNKTCALFILIFEDTALCQVFNEKEYKFHTKLKVYSIMVTNGNTSSISLFKSYIKHLGGSDEYHFYLPYQTINIGLRC